jgi:hypothetical protein
MKNNLKVTILFGLTTGVASLVFGAGAPQEQASDADGVRQAVRFERSKDAAAARQARQEPTQEQTKSAQTMEAKSELGTATGAAVPDDGGVQAAIRFERAKQAADAQQARVEATHSGEATRTSVTASRR